MTRRIVLELADDTTETECGACPQIGEPRGHWCSVWGAMTIGRKRPTECLAAEARAARMVEIDPEDARQMDCACMAPDCIERIARVEAILRLHGRKGVSRG